MSSPDLDSHLLARELVRQGKTPEEVQQELIARGIPAEEAADIAGLARTMDVMMHYSRRSGQSPEWLERGDNWLDLIGFLFIVGGAASLILGTIGAARGVREPFASVLLLSGAAVGLGFGVCLMLHQTWARWTAFALALLVFAIVVGQAVVQIVADPYQAFSAGKLLFGLGKILIAVLVLLLGVRARRQP